MRSPSEPESSDSREHSLLEAVESGHYTPDERRARCKLLEESEKNMRANAFPHLYPRRSRNMQLLFELLRQCNAPHYSDFWLEARLLRLTDRHDQCRQLCQSRPMYDWTFDVLQEFVWAGRGDCYPYERRTDFLSDEERAMAGQLYTAAGTLHDAKCYQWQQAHAAAAKPTPKEQRTSLITGVGLFIIFIAAIVAWNVYSGWIALTVFCVGSGLLFTMFGDDTDMVRERMAAWTKQNPKPRPMRLALHHEPLPHPVIGFPDIA